MLAQKCVYVCVFFVSDDFNILLQQYNVCLVGIFLKLKFCIVCVRACTKHISEILLNSITINLSFIPGRRRAHIEYC